VEADPEDMSRSIRTLVVVNPVSAGGSTRRLWPRIRDCLARVCDYDVVFSQYPGHAVELGGEARAGGMSRVVCVGGDGTLHEVVNGMMGAGGADPMPQLAIVPTGTGSDFARSLGISFDLERACRRLESPRVLVTDLGMVSFVGRSGAEQRYFVNAAGLGYDAEVVSRRNGFNRYFRGTIPYLASLAATLLSYQNKSLTVTIDDVRDDRRVNALVVAVGRYFGGGMRIAPNAELDDGLFDVITLGDVGRIELIRNVPGVYRGAHLQHPKVTAERGAEIYVEARERVMLQADGELLGEIPALFRVLPGALTVLR
jgi:diacylglycerol kinase (ATP)